ncbi:DNA methyltransferase [Deinococcus rufus]|uniref:DNA methyltransferase n=1 Tax=Deinococcus rufus TaxID=2136097 RepID=A0ABV7ZB17_9DEIO
MLEPLDALVPHPQNPNRGHPEEIAESIRVNGWFGVVTAQRSSRRILVGEHRWRGARLAGLAQVPVFWVDVDDDAALAILLADNAYAERATRDPGKLRALLDQLAQGRGLTGTGYTGADHLALIQELDEGVHRELLTDEDDVPAEQSRVVTRPGDVWQLGPHRVRCGDSTDPAALRTLMGGEPADLIWTDPPYNVNYEGKTAKRLTIANDAMTPEEFRGFIRRAFEATLPVARAGACIYVAYAELEGAAFRVGFDAAGWRYSQTVIWVKNAPVLGRQDYNWRHEPILFGWKPGAGHYFCGDYTQQTVLDDSADLGKLGKPQLLALLQQIRELSSVVYEDKPARNALHPTMKPVKLVARLIRNSSRAGERVLDPFGGSGTTLIAAHQTGRVAYLQELDPVYVDVIVRRCRDATGIEAVRQDGAAFTTLEQEAAA